MTYPTTVSAKFISRPNRFIARVNIGGTEETVHVKNTGRCRELLVPGAEVILEDWEQAFREGRRSTRYDLIAVYKKGFGLINIDSQAPNKAAEEWLRKQDFDVVKSEYVFGDSRIDFYMEKAGVKYLMEIKGCTLEIDGKGFFPDAPTERGVKHLRELTRAVSEGYRAILGFVIQMDGIGTVYPNEATDPAFARAYEEAVSAGVEIKFLQCHIREDGFEIITPYQTEPDTARDRSLPRS